MGQQRRPDPPKDFTCHTPHAEQGPAFPPMPIILRWVAIPFLAEGLVRCFQVVLPSPLDVGAQHVDPRGAGGLSVLS